MSVKCPECGELSDSIKCYKLPGLWVSLVFYLKYQIITYVCCPKCMLKHIIKSGFTYNIITANIYWLFMILPMTVINLIRLRFKGHSKKVVEILYDNMENDQETA